MSNTKTFFAYIRVSTVKQGEHGVSLREQRDAIERYAVRHGFTISQWFEEQETAAKRGRPIFAKLMKLLRARRADGVLIHKIDRSARNFKDWADIADLIDDGIEVHFCHESIDLNTRGGRLTADIQAVIAADYIRNLREETRKGFYGRLKQGFYPLPAPLGYLDRGGGQVKELDPAKAPLVRKAFDLYGAGTWSLRELRKELTLLGLRNKGGHLLSLTGLSTILHNPFYAGLIRIRSTGETFRGGHAPLVPISLYERVQAILSGKYCPRVTTHDFLFRRLFNCAQCGYALIGELQKGHVYYRCHTKTCPTTCVREDAIVETIEATLRPVELFPEEAAELQGMAGDFRANWETERERAIQALQFQINQVNDRVNRLTDAYIDRLIAKELFEERRTALLKEERVIEEKLALIRGDTSLIPDQLSEFLELVSALSANYETRMPEEKRILLKRITSNRAVDRKNVVIELQKPFREIANRRNVLHGAPCRRLHRTRLVNVFSSLVSYFTTNMWGD